MAGHAGGLIGGFGIVNYDSLEQLAEGLATMPVAALGNVKVYPLVAPEVAERLIEVGLKSLPKQ